MPRFLVVIFVRFLGFLEWSRVGGICWAKLVVPQVYIHSWWAVSCFGVNFRDYNFSRKSCNHEVQFSGQLKEYFNQSQNSRNNWASGSFPACRSYLNWGLKFLKKTTWRQTQHASTPENYRLDTQTDRLEKVTSLQDRQFLVSMLDFWGVPLLT